MFAAAVGRHSPRVVALLLIHTAGVVYQYILKDHLVGSGMKHPCEGVWRPQILKQDSINHLEPHAAECLLVYDNFLF